MDAEFTKSYKQENGENMNRMYRENRKSINAFVGCRHGCVYCKPSFQRQAKRQRKNCQLCYRFEPHFHEERLLKAPPKTEKDEFIFFPSMGDPAFCQPEEFKAMLNYARKYGDRRFLIQTKAPEFLKYYDHQFPENVILGVTLETNLSYFQTPSNYHDYESMSKAPIPVNRAIDFHAVNHKPKFVIVEPILDFNHIHFCNVIRAINPEVVYVGYDNHGCYLPEPQLSKTKRLIKELEKFTEVRVKTLKIDAQNVVLKVPLLQADYVKNV